MMDVGAVVLWWLLVIGLLGSALPLTAWLLPDTPDKGAFIALPVALMVIVLPVYWIGHVTFGVFTVFFGLAVLLAGSVLFRRRGYRGKRGPTLEILAVFTTAFLFLLAIRSVDPGAHPGGGEKFLDHGLLLSLLRADRLPPPDMWFAGKHVVYYYGGHLVAAIQAHLIDVPGRLAYNLALSTAYAGAVTAVYGLAGTIAVSRNLPRRIAAGLGAVFFGLASNLFVPVGAVGTLFSDELLQALADATGRTVEQATITRETFGYWWSSRVIPGTITEFPLFAYLNGDLHAHMTDTVFLLLIATIAYAYYRTPRADLTRRRLLVFGVVPPVIGFIGVINTWSLPTGVGLIWLTLWFADPPPGDLLLGTDRWMTQRSVSQTAGRILGATLLAVPLLIISLVWIAPYVLGILLGAGGTVKGIETVPEPTGLWTLFVAHGTFLLPFGWYIVTEAYAQDVSWWLGGTVIGVLVGIGYILDAPVMGTVVPLAVLAWLLHRRTRSEGSDGPGFEAILLVGGAGLVTLVEFLYLNEAASGGRYNTVFKVYAQVWPLWATAGAVTLTRAVQASRRVYDSRIREVIPVGLAGLFVASLLLYGGFSFLEHFRAYIDVWLAQLVPISIGIVIVGLASGLSLRYRDRLPTGFTIGLKRLHTGSSRHPVLASILVLSLILNLGLAAASTAGGPADPALDTRRFVEVWHPGEAAAIEWLADRSGQPHIVSAPGFGVYGWASPASSLTGLPTVVGWSHEANYRSLSAFQKRVEDVDALFRGSPTQRAVILSEYEVRYIYVGPNEQERYENVAFDFASEPGISIAHQSGQVTIYAVNRSALETSVN